MSDMTPIEYIESVGAALYPVRDPIGLVLGWAAHTTETGWTPVCDTIEGATETLRELRDSAQVRGWGK